MTEARIVIDAISHRLPGNHNVYPTVDTAVKIIAKRLFVNESGMVKSSTGLSVSFASNDASASLPSDFWGLYDRPYINGKTNVLKPLPSIAVKITYTSAGESNYYEIKDNTIHLTPTTSSAITINGDYFAKPSEITGPTSTIPWNGLFDDAIQHFLLKWYTGDEAKGAETFTVLKAFLENQVDLVSKKRDKKAPVNFEDEAGWSELVAESSY